MNLNNLLCVSAVFAFSIVATAQTKLAPIFRPDIIGLTGGTASDLDGAFGPTSADIGKIVIVNSAANGISEYRLVAGSDAESSPDVIRPDNYTASSNEVVWKLNNATANGLKSTSNLTVNDTLFVDGAANTVTAYHKFYADDALYVDGSTNTVGIGTTSPNTAFALDISGNARTDAEINLDTDGGSGFGAHLVIDDGGGWPTRAFQQFSSDVVTYQDYNNNGAFDQYTDYHFLSFDYLYWDVKIGGSGPSDPLVTIGQSAIAINNMPYIYGDFIISGDIAISGQTLNYDDSVVTRSLGDQRYGELTYTPFYASDPGTAGQWSYDSSYIYVCVSTDTWMRAALSTW